MSDNYYINEARRNMARLASRGMCEDAPCCGCCGGDDYFDASEYLGGDY